MSTLLDDFDTANSIHSPVHQSATFASRLNERNQVLAHIYQRGSEEGSETVIHSILKILLASQVSLGS